MKSDREIDLLDLSAKLRQLLIDGNSTLAHHVNRNHKLKLTFRVGEFSEYPDEYVAVQGLEDGLDPEGRRPGAPSKDVDFDGFLRHKILYLTGTSYSVRDVVKHAADAAGGIHRDENPNEQHKKIAEYSGGWIIGGLPAAIRQLRAIARVALRGLAPLVEVVTKEVSEIDWSLVPISDGRRDVALWDICFKGQWVGSRRTQMQCLEVLGFLGAKIDTP